MHRIIDITDNHTERRRVKTTSELLDAHTAELDAKLARRRARPEIVGGGSL